VNAISVLGHWNCI